MMVRLMLSSSLPRERQSVAAQYESAEMTSPPFRVARAWNTRPAGE